MNVLILGSGQLARMMYLAGCPLGLAISAVDVNQQQVVDPITKQPRSTTVTAAIDDADVITVEFEHIPEPLLRQARASGKLSPNFDAILTGADRVREKRLLQRLGIANCPHRIIDAPEQFDAKLTADLGEKLIVKSSRDGYDGYGQWHIRSKDDTQRIKKQLAGLDLHTNPLIAETMLTFDRELSLVGTRSKDGDIRCYPLVENRHCGGQLHVTIAPAQRITAALNEQAQAIFARLAEALNYVGVLAVEFFQLGDQLAVNEIAPRVHNSGHWTMQGANISQFESHLRAICGLPIGDNAHLGVTAMINIIGAASFSRSIMAIADCHLHWYGKQARAKRKLGHVNLSAPDYPQLANRLKQLSQHLPLAEFPLLEQTINDLH